MENSKKEVVSSSIKKETSSKKLNKTFYQLIQKIQVIFLIFPIILLGFVFFSFFIKHNFYTSLILTLIMWSFYILCIPAFHGKIVLGKIYKIITKKTLKYPELIVWPIALIFTISTFFLLKNIYLSTIGTHLFYILLQNPWPYWWIFLISGIGTFYRSIIGYNNFFKYKKVHYTLRTLIVIMGILMLFYLSYSELIILLNVSF